MGLKPRQSDHNRNDLAVEKDFVDFAFVEPEDPSIKTDTLVKIPSNQSTSRSAGRKRKFPNSEGKTHEDIRALALEPFAPLEGTVIDTDNCLDIALTDLQLGNPVDAVEAFGISRNHMTGVNGAELAVHCLKRGHDKEAAPLITASEMGLEKTPDKHRCALNAYLATCYYLKGNHPKAERYEKAALRILDSAKNRDGLWFLIQYWSLSGQTKKIVDKFSSEWKESDFSNSELDNTMLCYIWYGELDSMMSVVSAFQNDDCPLIEESEYYHYVGQKIIREKAYDRLRDIAPQFEYTYRNELIGYCLETLSSEDTNARQIFNYYLRDYNCEGSLSHWLRFLVAAAAQYSDLASEVLGERSWNLGKVEDWDDYEEHSSWTFFSLGKLVGQLEQWQNFTKETETVPSGFLCSFLSGIAVSTGDMGLREELITRARKLLHGLAGEDVIRLWAQLAIASASSEMHNEILKCAIEVASTHDKNQSLASLVEILSDKGILDAAHTVWTKMAKASRKYQVQPLLKGYCRTKDYNPLFDLLMSIESIGVDLRGQSASYVLNALTNSRGYKF